MMPAPPNPINTVNPRVGNPYSGQMAHSYRFDTPDGQTSCPARPMFGQAPPVPFVEEDAQDSEAVPYSVPQADPRPGYRMQVSYGLCSGAASAELSPRRWRG